MPVESPPQSVLDAFGAAGDPVPLAGGSGSSWRAGDVVLKPLQFDSMGSDELAWQADVLDTIRCDGFRVARARRAPEGSPLVDGWSAWEYVEGRHEARRWADVIAVGERFHAALADIPRPAFIAARTDGWAIGDRVAWGEHRPDDFEHVPHVSRLLDAVRSVSVPGQLIHGDLGGNVLFADDLPPAVIDFAPYWRPPAFASAIVVGDALVWEGADETILAAVGHVQDFEQYLLRALIYRIVAAAVLRPSDVSPEEFGPASDLALRLAQSAAPTGSAIPFGEGHALPGGNRAPG